MGSAKSSPRPAATPSAKTALAVSIAALAAACATAPTTPGPPPMTTGGPVPPPETQVQTREGVTPPFMRGRELVRVGLLLPFSLRPQDAAALYNAAELALFDHGDQNILLIPRDAGADEASATAAARALVADGADIIVGPVLREGVAGAANVARSRNVPVIGFSSDRTVAGNGVYLLSFQLEDEIARLVSFAASRNIRQIALFAPANEYGRRVEGAVRAQAQMQGVTIVHAQLYNRTDSDASAAATAFARSPQAAQAQGVLIADSGGPLRSIGVALVQGGVDQRRVRFMGTSVWAGEAQREPSLAGGWYVATDPAARTAFENRYQRAFQTEPTRLASLSYDAVALAALLSRNAGPGGLSRPRLENGQGFSGSDGLFRFRSDGAIERGLAVMEVGQNTNTVLDAAPRAFPAS